MVVDWFIAWFFCVCCSHDMFALDLRQQWIKRAKKKSGKIGLWKCKNIRVCVCVVYEIFFVDSELGLKFKAPPSVWLKGWKSRKIRFIVTWYCDKARRRVWEKRISYMINIGDHFSSLCPSHCPFMCIKFLIPWRRRQRHHRHDVYVKSRTIKWFHLMASTWWNNECIISQW